MIVLSGTKRSGTSLWMHILSEAGLRYIGDRFPRNWEDKLKAANPNGFYESSLRGGIHWMTNPHPKTGRYLRPEDTRRHLVKVFPAGTARSDIAFLDHVVVTIRPWRDVCRSIRKMRAIEAEVFDWTSRDTPRNFLPPEVEWLRENFLLVRDLNLRRYNAIVQPQRQLMADPVNTIRSVLAFLDLPTEQADSLATCIDVARGSHRSDTSETVFDPETLERVDGWMEAVDRGDWAHPSALADLDAAWKRAHAARLFQEFPWDDPRVCGPV